MHFFKYNKKCVKMFVLNKNLFAINGQIRKLSDNSVRLSYYCLTPINSQFNNKKESFPILIFHGLFGSKNNWKTISKSMASKTGRSVYAFDLRNHGSSPQTSGIDSHLMAMSNDIKLFLDQNNLEKASLIGHRFSFISIQLNLY